MSVGGTASLVGITALPIMARIASICPSLNQAQQKVAQFVRDNPETVVGSSITELASRAGVGTTTVMRFCKEIGFGSYPDLKVALAEELGRHRSALPIEHADVSPEDPYELLIEKVFSVDIQAIANTQSTLDSGEFARAVDTLCNARTVAIFGSGGSLAVGLDAYYRFLRSGKQCSISVDTHMQAVNAGLLEPGDVGLAISFSGETQDVIDCVGLAAESGATTMCITNHPQSTLAGRCGICLSASSAKTRWISDAVAARLAQLALIDALCVAISRMNEPKLLSLVNRIDKAAATKRFRK
ncbi:MAG: MurR/RpiR family transcriptional regulator [Armatimonadota bacterium]